MRFSVSSGLITMIRWMNCRTLVVGVCLIFEFLSFFGFVVGGQAIPAVAPAGGLTESKGGDNVWIAVLSAPGWEGMFG